MFFPGVVGANVANLGVDNFPSRRPDVSFLVSSLLATEEIRNGALGMYGPVSTKCAAKDFTVKMQRRKNPVVYVPFGNAAIISAAASTDRQLVFRVMCRRSCARMNKSRFETLTGWRNGCFGASPRCLSRSSTTNYFRLSRWRKIMRPAWWGNKRHTRLGSWTPLCRWNRPQGQNGFTPACGHPSEGGVFPS